MRHRRRLRSFSCVITLIALLAAAPGLSIKPQQPAVMPLCIYTEGLGDIGWLARRVVVTEAHRAATLWAKAPCAPVHFNVALCKGQPGPLAQDGRSSVTWAPGIIHQRPDGRRSFSASVVHPSPTAHFSEGDIVLDNSVGWYVSGHPLRAEHSATERAELSVTLAHEIGHLLGVGHSDTPSCDLHDGRKHRQACLAVDGCSWTDFHNNCFDSGQLRRRFCSQPRRALMCSRYDPRQPLTLQPVDQTLLCASNPRATPPANTIHPQELQGGPGGSWLWLWLWRMTNRLAPQ